MRVPTMRVLWTLLAAALLSGCGLAQKAMFPPSAPHVTIQADEFSKQIEIVGTGLYDNPLMGPFRNWMLRSWVDRQSGAVDHQLYIETHYYGTWPRFNAAADDETNALRTMRIDRHVEPSCRGNDCLYYETDTVVIGDDFLRRRAASGFRVKLYAHGGDTQIFEVTPQMIGLQLEAVDRMKAGRAAGDKP